MHFEILVEGQADCTALSILMPKILGTYGEAHTWKIHKHRGIGKIPENPTSAPNKTDQTLLHNLTPKLRAYGRENRNDLAVIVVVDLDDRESCSAFKTELTSLLTHCAPAPRTLFRIAIEELEAWFLGDQPALSAAYPSTKFGVLLDYVQDAQCGTWEKLADAIYPGGLATLNNLGKRSPHILEQKRKWAAAICPHMNVDGNLSPSFAAFRDGVRGLAAP